MEFYQLTWVQVAFRLSAALSIFGSSWILASIVRDRKKRNTCYHRLLFGLSVFDLLLSIGLFIGTWAQSHKSSFSIDASSISTGNIITCDASGFTIYMGSLAIPFYNAALNVYYYLAVCQGWKEQKMKKQFERYVHICICPVVVVMATIPIFFRIYNPYHFFCFIADPEPTPTTIQSMFFLIYSICVILCSVIIGISMISIIRYVKKTSRKSESYSFRGKGVASTRRSRRRSQLSSEVKIMAFLYSVPFVITWLIPVMWTTCVYITWSTSFHIVPFGNNAIHQIFSGYITIFLPLQGFFNWLVYMRPRLKKFMAASKNMGYECLFETVDIIIFSCIFCLRGCQEPEDDMDDEDFYGENDVEGFPEEICSNEGFEDSDDSYNLSFSKGGGVSDEDDGSVEGSMDGFSTTESPDFNSSENSVGGSLSTDTRSSSSKLALT